MNYSEMTKKELLKIAGDAGIVGRHDMSKDLLVDALNSINNEDKGIDAETLKNIKRRTPSINDRDDNGNVIRAGRNLSGNAPFRKKFYFLSEEFSDLEAASEEYRDAVAAAPNQVKLILRYMREFDVTSAEEAMQGGHIVEDAKNRSYIQSKIPSPNLFAYYRRVLEALGVTQA